MNSIIPILHRKIHLAAAIAVIAAVIVSPLACMAQQAPMSPQPVVAVHVSELTGALETMPASPPTPMGTGTTGYEWWYTSWHYFTAHESLKEALRSDGTPFAEVSDGDIAAGELLHPDGSPRYPILISLFSEAVAENELAPLRAYVAAGGMLFIGSSAFTRRPDGTSRGNFAFAGQMGLYMETPVLDNWRENLHFTKTTSHRLTSHIPGGVLEWRTPLSADEIPWGISPGHALHGKHYLWQVIASGATVLAEGDSGYPLLAVKSYGKGQFIYHGTEQPLIGHGGFGPGMYAYLIYRKAVEWAFESFSLPLVKVSPWPYQYDAAFIIRHDLENNQSSIRSIEASAELEYTLGAKGDYYFCTGTVRDEMTGSDKTNTIAGLKSAVANYGATIGSHNGGFGNPNNPSLTPADYDYWHWGPDEALDIIPPGYSSGRAYARASILRSFKDIEGWLSGFDNGRPGCGASKTCPRTWVSPYFNSTREDSRAILEELGSITTGEQKISPFPHWNLSYETPGAYFAHVTLPASDWYVGTTIAQGLNKASGSNYHSTASLRAAVDFYYDLGALINIYGHMPTTPGSLEEEYAAYSMAKPRLWSANTVGVYDWWEARSNVVANTTVAVTGDTFVASASVSGAVDPATAIEIVVPNLTNPEVGDFAVFLNGEAADPADYRIRGNTLKIRVGVSPAVVEVQHPPDKTPPGAPNVTGTAQTNVTTPTWSWMSGGGGTGAYRYKLDNSDLSTGATTTMGTSYTPASALTKATHTLYVQERDAAGNWSATGSFAVVIDTTAPTLAISAPSQPATYSGNGPVTFTVTYLGADTVTLGAGDITLNATGAASGVVAVSGDGAALRTVTISNITGYGALGITIAANTAGDGAGNKASPAGPSATFSVTNSSGDFDNDGVNVSDALKALRIAAGLDKPTTTDLLFGDVAPWVNGKLLPDGRIDISDVVVVLRKAVGLTTW